jgi:hypothetical protein
LILYLLLVLILLLLLDLLLPFCLRITLLNYFFLYNIKIICILVNQVLTLSISITDNLALLILIKIILLTIISESQWILFLIILRKILVTLMMYDWIFTEILILLNKIFHHLFHFLLDFFYSLWTKCTSEFRLLVFILRVTN